MRDDLGERRYSDDELRRILRDATQSHQQPGQLPDNRDGLTLAQIRDIAQEAGIDPARVDRAAANRLASESMETPIPSRFKLARLLHEDLSIARPLSPEELRQVGQQAQRVLGSRGALSVSNDMVEWRDRKNRLYVAIARGRDRTLIRVIADQTGELVTGSIIIGIVGVLGLGTAAGASGTQLLIQVGATLGVIVLHAWWRTRKARRYLRGHFVPNITIGVPVVAALRKITTLPLEVPRARR